MMRLYACIYRVMAENASSTCDARFLAIFTQDVSIYLRTRHAAFIAHEHTCIHNHPPTPTHTYTHLPTHIQRERQTDRQRQRQRQEQRQTETERDRERETERERDTEID